MKLTQVLKGIRFEKFGKDVEISNIEHNSKNVKHGALFLCLKGSTTDGSTFINEAIQNGASAIVVDRQFFE